MKHDFDTTEHYQNAGIVGGLQKKQKKNMRTKNEHKNAKALNAKILAECFCSAVQRFSKYDQQDVHNSLDQSWS